MNECKALNKNSITCVSWSAMSRPFSSIPGARSLLSCSTVTGKQGSNCAELLFLAPVCREPWPLRVCTHACVCACLCVRVSVQLLSHVWLFATPRTIICQAPLSMKFSRQEYWSGLPFSSARDLPNPEIKPESPVSKSHLMAGALNRSLS